MSDRERAAACKEFVSEAEELLENLSSDLIEYEKGFRTQTIKPALVNQIFREVHSLKGLAGMLGFERISTLSHDLENLLDRLRLGKAKPSEDMINVLFASQEFLKQMVVHIHAEGLEGDEDIQPLVTLIHELSSETASVSETNALACLDLSEDTLKSLTEYEEHRLHDNLENKIPIYSIVFGFSFDVFDTQLKEAADNLNEVGEVISTLPSTGGKEPDKIFFRLIFATEIPTGEIDTIIAPFGGNCESLLKELAPTPSVPSGDDTPKQAAPDEIETSLKSISQTVRVDIKKLDETMAVVGELALQKNMLERLCRQMATELGASPLSLELLKTARGFDRKLASLQSSIISIRMVPISQIFSKLSQTARKIAAQFNKKIELKFSGGDTELDKMMIEEITNPFVHLIRNSIDHGIETPEVRRAKGKPETGVVHLKAYPKGNSVVVEITDDGAGISPDKIQKAALAKGIIDKNTELTFNDCLDLIFSPGFSSASSVSEISGRGVGLDVVKENITRLKGTINVTSEIDQGATFQIMLPITLAILRALFVETSGQRFAVPLTSVAESLRVHPDQIQTVEHREVIRLRDMTIPLVRLNRFFGLNGNNGASSDKLYVVIVQSAEKRAGLIVDRLRGEQEVVIKSMGKHLAGLPGLAGVCEVGEHDLIFVLDIGSLLIHASEEQRDADMVPQ